MNLESVRTQEFMVHCLKFYGFKMKAPLSTEHILAECPDHHDEHPSFRVYPDGHGHCFTCGFHCASAIDLIAHMRKVSPASKIIPKLPDLPETAHLGLQWTHAASPYGESLAPPISHSRAIYTKTESEEKDRAIQEFFQWVEENGRFAINYWCCKRRIDQDVVKSMKLMSFNPIEASVWMADRYNIDALIKFGFKRSPSSRNWIWSVRGAGYNLVIPSFENPGVVSGLQFRMENAPGSKLPRFLSLQPTGLIGHTATIVPSRPIWVCEGASDTATLQTFGLQAVGVMGIGLASQVTFLPMNDTDVLIAFDRPQKETRAPEEAATRRASQFIEAGGGRPWRILPPEEYKDWNEAFMAGALLPSTRDRVPAEAVRMES